MNPAYVQTLPLPAILNKLGLTPVEKNTIRYLYHSPFHEHSVPTLEVLIADNSWRDTYSNSSGGPLSLVQSWLLHQGLKCTEVDALHWIKFNIGYPGMVNKFGLQKVETTEQYRIVFKTILQEKSLVRYALQHDFSYSDARKIFKQVYVLNMATGKEFRALGMRNEEGGYALYNPHLETVAGPVSISFIRGDKNDYGRIYVFRSPFDYQRALQLHPSIADDDSILLHVYGSADHAAGYIRSFGYKRLYTGFDDSSQGQRATQAFAWLCSTETDLVHKQINLKRTSL